MKKLYIIFSLALVSTSLYAQTTATKKADKLFNQYKYVAKPMVMYTNN